jgi:hypothetical protein
MTDALTNFLVNLAVDADLQAQYASDPEGVMSRAGLSATERAAMLTRDTARIRAVLGHGHAHHMTQEGKPGRRKSSKKKAASRKGAKKGAKKKGGSR